MVDLLKAVFLGVLQGLTEFLPISSSAHLRIFPELFGWGDPGAAFTAIIQIGTEVAVLLYFAKDIWRIARAWVRSLYDASWRGHEDARMGWYVIVGTTVRKSRYFASSTTPMITKASAVVTASAS